MSPTIIEPNRSQPLRSRRPNTQASTQNPLSQLRVPMRSPAKPGTIKVSDIVGPLIADPLAAPNEHTKEQPAPDSFVSKTKKSLWQQLAHGAALAFKVIVPTWILMWLGGFVAHKAIVTLGLKAAPPISRSLDSAVLQRAQINSTPDLSASIVRAQNIRTALQNGNISGADALKALGTNDLSDQAIWKKLSATRRLLNDYSPQLSVWLEQKAARGEVVFVADDFEFGGERYSDYRSWNHRLTIYPGFFDLNDGQKVSIIRHERSHADETWPEYVSNSLQPSVFVGATLRAGSMLVGNTSTLLSTTIRSNFPAAAAALDKTAQSFLQVDDPESLASQLRYSGNRSERQAMQSELEASSTLGVAMAADQMTIDSISTQNRNPVPWQEVVGLSALSAYGLARLLRRRPKSELTMQRRSMRLAGSNV